MFAIQLLLAIVTLAFAGSIARKGLVRHDGQWSFNPVNMIIAVAIAVVMFVGVLPSFGEVPAGHRGVVLRFGAVTGEVKNEGLYFVTPFVTRVQLLNVQVHAHKAPATAASKDLQDVSTEITLNYRLDPAAVAAVWRELGSDFEARIITPSVQEAVKATTARFDAERLIVERPTVRATIEDMLKERLERHHVLLDQVSITNFQFSPEFSQAIEAKVVATQQALKASNDLTRIRVEAEQRVAQARAEAEAIRIQAEAVRAQGGAAYVQLKWVEKWNGVLPTTSLGSGSAPLVMVGGGK